MSLVEDVRASFQVKGLTFVSLSESSEDPEKTTLTYTDGSGKTVRKEVKNAARDARGDDGRSR